MKYVVLYFSLQKINPTITPVEAMLSRRSLSFAQPQGNEGHALCPICIFRALCSGSDLGTLSK